MNGMIPCRTGEHLSQCENFECNQNFKCPGHYCIPHGYVCDGKWDCPTGADESKTAECGIKRSCNSLFKCRSSQICAHLGDVCDGEKDCLLEDDELMCDIKDTCPKSCDCLLCALSCVHLHTERKSQIYFMWHIFCFQKISKA